MTTKQQRISKPSDYYRKLPLFKILLIILLLCSVGLNIYLGVNKTSTESYSNCTTPSSITINLDPSNSEVTQYGCNWRLQEGYKNDTTDTNTRTLFLSDQKITNIRVEKLDAKGLFFYYDSNLDCAKTIQSGQYDISNTLSWKPTITFASPSSDYYTQINYYRNYNIPGYFTYSYNNKNPKLTFYSTDSNNTVDNQFKLNPNDSLCVGHTLAVQGWVDMPMGNLNQSEVDDGTALWNPKKDNIKHGYECNFYTLPLTGDGQTSNKSKYQSVNVGLGKGGACPKSCP